MTRKIHILVVTYLPWRDDNSIGNSYSNIFKGTEERYELAHVYVRDGMPQNTLVKDYYHISEKKLMKSFFHRNVTVGKALHMENTAETPKDKFSKAYNIMRILRWDVFFVGRKIIQMNNRWKAEEFDKFLDNFKPDLVFGTLPTEPILSNIMIYVKNHCHIPLVTYPWDDWYSFKSGDWKPFTFINRLMSRHYLRKTASESKFLYVITRLMKTEYEKIFHKTCRLMYKGYDFPQEAPISKAIGKPIHLVYMGNIGSGRWKTLADIATAIKQVNHDGQKFFMDVYTLSPTNTAIKNGLNIDGASKINPPVPNDEKEQVMDNADILIHAEPFKKTDYEMYRASFSTKLGDYFYAAKCILAVGGMTASTDYLMQNDAAICVTDKGEIANKLSEIALKPSIISDYAKKSWECGFKNHQRKNIQARMYNDFSKLINK